jgi:hypothetical protein
MHNRRLRTSSMLLAVGGYGLAVGVADDTNMLELLAQMHMHTLCNVSIVEKGHRHREMEEQTVHVLLCYISPANTNEVLDYLGDYRFSRIAFRRKSLCTIKLIHLILTSCR